MVLGYTKNADTRSTGFNDAVDIVVVVSPDIGIGADDGARATGREHHGEGADVHVVVGTGVLKQRFAVFGFAGVDEGWCLAAERD